MCTKPSKFSASAGLDRAEGSSTAGKARDASDFTDLDNGFCAGLRLLHAPTRL